MEEYMSWGLFERGCLSLAKKAQSFDVENVYGLPRGGLVPAVKLSHVLELPLLTDAKKIGKRTLIVDDIADSGKTLSAFKEQRKATLYYCRKSTVVPDAWAYEKTDCWVVFPWEVLRDKREPAYAAGAKPKKL